MKLMMKVFISLTILVVVAFPTTVMAGSILYDRIIFGENFTLLSGEVLDGNLIIFGGNIILQQDSTVQKEVVIFGGNLDASGTVEGSIVSLGGNIDLQSTSITKGDVITVGGNLDRAAGALVEGDVASEISPPMTLIYPGRWEIPGLAQLFSPIFNTVTFTFTIFLWAGLAVLMILFLPDHMLRISQAVVSQPILAGGLGLLTVIVVPPLLLVLLITILLSPVAFIGAVVALMAWIVGFIAVGYELGNRLAASMRHEWAPALSAGVGTFLLMLVVNGVRSIVPCIGWTVPALVGMLGLGAVLLTRFGIQPYPLVNPKSPVRPEPPFAPAQAETLPDEKLPDPLGEVPSSNIHQTPPDLNDPGI